MSTMIIDNNNWVLNQNITQQTGTSHTLHTSGRIVNKDIVINTSVQSGSVTTTPTTITINPTITFNSTTGEITASYSDTTSVLPDVTAAGWISSGTAGTITSTGSSTIPASTVIGSNTSSSLTVNGRTVTAAAGYYPTSVSAQVDVGDITSGSASINSVTYTYQSSSNNFSVSGKATVSAPTVNTAGYISTTEGTKNARTDGAVVQTTVNRIALGTSGSGRTTNSVVTPVISKEPITITGVTDAASGSATTTAPTSGVYVAVQSAANSGSLTVAPTVTTTGYGTPTAGQYTGTSSTYTVGANASAVTYVPITTTTRSKGNGHISMTAGAGEATCTIGNGDSASATNPSLILGTTTPTSGVYYALTITGKGSVTGTGSGDVSTGSGWVTSGTTTSNTASDTISSNTDTIYRYLTKSVADAAVAHASPTGRTANTYLDLTIQPAGYIRIPAGYYPLDRYIISEQADEDVEATQSGNYSLNVSSISGADTVSVGTLASDYYPIIANNISVTGTLSAGTAGWFTSGSATDSDTDSVTVGKMRAAVLGAISADNATATISAQPGTVSIAKNTTGVTGKTRLDITPVTATSGITKYYLAVKATAAENTNQTAAITGSTSVSVTTAGYAPTTLSKTGTIAGTATANVQAKDSAVYYLPIPSAAGSVTTTAGSGSCIYNSTQSSNITVSDTNTSGVAIAFDGSGTVTSSASITTNGYAETDLVFTNSGTSTASNVATGKKYLTSVRVPAPASGTNVFTLTVPNGSTTEFISFEFTVDPQGNVTVDGTGVYTGIYD